MTDLCGMNLLSVLCGYCFVTDAGFKPAVQGSMIEALTGERPNIRAIHNHAAAHGRQKTPYNANELLQRVRVRSVTSTIPTTMHVLDVFFDSLVDLRLCIRLKPRAKKHRAAQQYLNQHVPPAR